MWKFIYFIVISSIILVTSAIEKSPTIFVSVLVRNKAHTLPYFLTLLESQNYNKKRISVQIVSDHNEDNSIELLDKWIHNVSSQYHSVEFLYDDSVSKYPGEEGPADWVQLRFSHLIYLREAALDKARRSWAQFIFVLDADAFLTNLNTLQYLVRQKHTVVAPLLKSNGLYSNFWAGMTETYYYTRTDDYQPILKGERKGCFQVPMVHSAVFVNLQNDESDALTYNGSRVSGYRGPRDDIITFAVTANMSGIPLYVCNEETFGYITVPLESDGGLVFDKEQLTNLKLEVLTDGPPLPVSPVLQSFVKPVPSDRLGMDAIYVINLPRRVERRRRMEECFRELGLDVRFIDAVDGRALDDEELEKRGVHQMPAYLDPYHKRPMKRGEIGCFLSHYEIWQQMVTTGEDIAMILEDDVRFEPFFRRKFLAIMKEVDNLQLEWDLIYLGRKRLKQDEDWVEGSKSLVHVTYSYWTLGYILTMSGARKLLSQDPLSNMLPVDEYIPIMFDQHPEDEWKAYFPSRDLRAFSVAPLLIFPTHYTGETGYISDTEESPVISDGSSPRDDL